MYVVMVIVVAPPYHHYGQIDSRGYLYLQHYTYTHTRGRTSISAPCPSMIPPLSRRKMRLQPPILHRHTAPHPPLQHSTPIQTPHLPPLDPQLTRIWALPTRLVLRHTIAIPIKQPQMLARSAHTHVLPFQLALLGPATLTQEEHPRAVNGPVAEEARAGEVKGPRCQRVREVVAYRGCGRLALASWSRTAKVAVLIRGSMPPGPPFLARFCIRDVEEKGVW